MARARTIAWRDCGRRYESRKNETATRNLRLSENGRPPRSPGALSVSSRISSPLSPQIASVANAPSTAPGVAKAPTGMDALVAQLDQAIANLNSQFGSAA